MNGVSLDNGSTQGQSAQTWTKRRIAHAIGFCAVALVAAICLLMPGGFAFALDVNSCTAKPNVEKGSTVLGGKETRITWEAQAAPDEHVEAIALEIPAGTQIGLATDGASPSTYRLTVLSGNDFMTRNTVDAEVSAVDGMVVVKFDEPLDFNGPYRVRLELYGVFFPADGGMMQLTGNYTLADGTQLPLPDSPAINVEGTPALKQFTDWLGEQPWVQAWNSVPFLNLFLNLVVMIQSFPVVFRGFLMALAVVAVAFPLAIPIGLLLALMRMSRLRILRGIGSFYVNVVRGTPMFLQLYIAFLGLPLAGIEIPDFILAFIALALNSAAYMCEIFRAGIQSIPKGQFEAARSLGMSGAQTMMSVIIPQTIRRVLPTMTNEFILLYKDTSLLAGVGFMEIIMYARSIVAATGSITPYIVAALFYLVITIPLASFVGKLEKRLAGNDGGAAAASEKKAKKEKKRAIREATRSLSPGIMEEKLEAAPHSPVGEGTDPDDISMSPERFSSM